MLLPHRTTTTLCTLLLLLASAGGQGWRASSPDIVHPATAGTSTVVPAFTGATLGVLILAVTALAIAATVLALPAASGAARRVGGLLCEGLGGLCALTQWIEVIHGGPELECESRSRLDAVASVLAARVCEDRGSDASRRRTRVAATLQRMRLLESQALRSLATPQSARAKGGPDSAAAECVTFALRPVRLVSSQAVIIEAAAEKKVMGFNLAKLSLPAGSPTTPTGAFSPGDSAAGLSAARGAADSDAVLLKWDLYNK